MNFRDLIDRVSTETGLPRTKVRAVLDAATATALEALSTRETVHWTGLGRLEVWQRPPRAIRSISDARKLLLGPRHAVRFRPAGALRDAVARLDDPTWATPAVQAAWRTAETLVSDLALYHAADKPAELSEDADDDAVLAACRASFGATWSQVERVFAERVDASAADRLDLLASAARRRFATA